MKVKIILNPYADRWGAKRRIKDVVAACDAAGLDAELFLTTGPGSGRQEAAASAAGGCEALVAAGGDGTVNEVLNGLLSVSADGSGPALGVLPIGTGNDFGDTAGLPRDLFAAARVIAAGQISRVDLGRVTVDGRPHYFANNCALAMEPMVTLENIRMTRLSGNIRYAAAVVKALVKLRAWQMRVRWEGGGYEGPVYLLSICNGRRTGGIFPIAPHALLDDGLFDVVLAPEVSKVTVLVVLFQLLRGRHIYHSQVTYDRAAGLEIDSAPGTPVHADGELIAESAVRVRYELLPGKIALLAP